MWITVFFKVHERNKLKLCIFLAMRFRIGTPKVHRVMKHFLEFE